MGLGRTWSAETHYFRKGFHSTWPARYGEELHMKFGIVVGILLGLLAQPAIVTVTEIEPNLLVFETSGGNVVASVGPDGALLVGTPPASSTPEISSILAARTKSAMRYLVIFPRPIRKAMLVGGSAAPLSPCMKMSFGA